MLGLATALNSVSLKKKSVLTNKFSAELDGTGDYIDITSLSSDLNKAAGTISMWIKVQATSGNESFFNCSAGDSTDNKIFLIYQTSGTKLQAGYKFSGTSIIAAHTIEGDSLVGLGWFHLAMTYNTSTPLIQLFLNGTRVAQRTTSLTTISEDVAIDRIRLGSNSTGNDTYHYGNIDEFIYIAGKDLTETEMLLLYNNGKPDDIGDLPSAIYNAIKCWLRFGEGSIDGSADQTLVIFDQKNATLGSELVSNGDFATSGTVTNNSHSLGFRTSDDDVTISDGVLNLVNADNSSFDGRVQFTNGSSGALAITSGGAHVLEYEVVANDANSSLFLYTGSGYVTLTKTVGVHKYIYTTNGSAVYLRNGSNNTTIKIDNVSLKEVQGNPGFCVADATVGNANVP